MPRRAAALHGAGHRCGQWGELLLGSDGMRRVPEVAVEGWEAKALGEVRTGGFGLGFGTGEFLAHFDVFFCFWLGGFWEITILKKIKQKRGEHVSLAFWNVLVCVFLNFSFKWDNWAWFQKTHGFNRRDFGPLSTISSRSRLYHRMRRRRDLWPRILCSRVGLPSCAVDLVLPCVVVVVDTGMFLEKDNVDQWRLKLFT